MESSNLFRPGFADTPFNRRKAFRHGLLQDLSLRQLDYGKFPKIDDETDATFLEALIVAYTFVEFRNRFLTEDRGSSEHLISGVVAELLAPVLNPIDSSSKESARYHFTCVMKKAFSFKWFYSNTNLTDYVYSTLPDYGTPADSSLLGTPITKLENFSHFPTGCKPNLTFENLYQFMILCSHHSKESALFLKIRTVTAVLVSFGWPSLLFVNRTVQTETGVDPKLTSREISFLRTSVIDELNDETALRVFQKWLTLLPDKNLKTYLLHEITSLTHYHAINDAIVKHPHFPWQKIVELIPNECIAFELARSAVGSNTFYGLRRRDLGPARRGMFQCLSLVGLKLCHLGWDDLFAFLRRKQPDLSLKLSQIIYDYWGGSVEHQRNLAEAALLTPDLKQVYDKLIQNN